ncbi:MAG: cupredoxin domain-containing protein [Chloroflexota bacterium]
MRRLIAAGSLLAVAVLLSACAASQSPNWTYAPPTPAPTAGPSQSAAASAEASAPASAAPSAEASAGGSAPAPSQGGGAGGTVVDITALNVDWTTKDVTAPANAPFKIHFDNQDASTPHNIVIKDGQGQQFLSTDLLTGPATADYEVPALAAGTYQFTCQVHPNMIGTLTVK